MKNDNVILVTKASFAKISLKEHWRILLITKSISVLNSHSTHNGRRLTPRRHFEKYFKNGKSKISAIQFSANGI